MAREEVAKLLDRRGALLPLEVDSGQRELRIGEVTGINALGDFEIPLAQIQIPEQGIIHS